MPLSPEIALVAGQLEHLAMKNFRLVQRTRPAFATFQEVIEAEVPNFGQFTWDQIVELCHHNRFQAFRSKVLEMNDLLDANEMQSASKCVGTCSKNP